MRLVSRGEATAAECLSSAPQRPPPTYMPQLRRLRLRRIPPPMRLSIHGLPGPRGGGHHHPQGHRRVTSFANSTTGSTDDLIAPNPQTTTQRHTSCPLLPLQSTVASPPNSTLTLPFPVCKRKRARRVPHNCRVESYIELFWSESRRVFDAHKMKNETVEDCISRSQPHSRPPPARPVARSTSVVDVVWNKVCAVLRQKTSSGRDPSFSMRPQVDIRKCEHRFATRVL